MSCPRVLLVPELLDHIVDFIGDDRLSLKASSLVADAWSISTARHLFSTLKLNSNTPHDDYRVQSQAATDSPKDNGSSDEGAGASTSPLATGYTWLLTRHRVVDSVRAIHVYLPVPPSQSSSHVGPTSSFAHIFDTLGTFCHLRRLTVCANGSPALALPVSSPADHTLAPPSSVTLDTLEIDCSARRARQFPMIGMLAYVQEVQHLVLRGVDFGTSLLDKDDAEPALGTAAVLRTKVTQSVKLVGTRTSDVAAMCRALETCFDLSGTAFIAFEDHWADDLEDIVKRFIEQHMPRMSKLRFSSDVLRIYQMHSGRAGYTIRFDLSRLAVVPHSVELELGLLHHAVERRTTSSGRTIQGPWTRVHMQPPAPTKLWLAFMDILLSAPPGTLRHLSIGLAFPLLNVDLQRALNVLGQLDWSLLDRVLDRQAGLRALRIGVLQCSAFTPNGELEEAVHGKLSQRGSQLVQFWHS